MNLSDVFDNIDKVIPNGTSIDIKFNIGRIFNLTDFSHLILYERDRIHSYLYRFYRWPRYINGCYLLHCYTLPSKYYVPG